MAVGGARRPSRWMSVRREGLSGGRSRRREDGEQTHGEGGASSHGAAIIAPGVPDASPGGNVARVTFPGPPRPATLRTVSA